VEITEGLYLAPAAMSLGMFASATYALITGRRVPSDRPRGIGVGYPLLGVFCALQVVGYVGVRSGLLTPAVGGVLFLAALPLAVVALMRHLPRDPADAVDPPRAQLPR
jgi:hypothetical protein